MKKTSSDLAVLGGPPAFQEPLHVGRPNIPSRNVFSDLLSRSLDRRWLTNHGPCEQALARRLPERLGGRHCVLVANATLGLMLAARALGLKDEVVMPAFTFVGSAHALHWQGITPVFCEIDPRTHQIDPSAVEALITPRTTGLLAVHLFGRTADMDALEALARRRGLKLLVDAAHAVGCTIGGRPVGDRGDATVFSFHATKVMNSFEGGAVVTRDAALAERLRLMSNFGFSDTDRVDLLGINAKMSESAAAMGLASLDALDDFIAANRRNLDSYRRALHSIPGVSLVPYPDPAVSNCHYVIVEVDGGPRGPSRDDLLDVLKAENVLARRYFHPGCHRMEPYASSRPWSDVRLPRTEAAAARVLALPTGTAVGEREIETIGTILRVAMTAGEALGRRRMASSL